MDGPERLRERRYPAQVTVRMSSGLVFVVGAPGSRVSSWPWAPALVFGGRRRAQIKARGYSAGASARSSRRSMRSRRT